MDWINSSVSSIHLRFCTCYFLFSHGELVHTHTHTLIHTHICIDVIDQSLFYKDVEAYHMFNTCTHTHSHVWNVLRSLLQAGTSHYACHQRFRGLIMFVKHVNQQCCVWGGKHLRAKSVFLEQMGIMGALRA